MPTSGEFHNISVASIKIPKDRQRRDMNAETRSKRTQQHIESLATSIRNVGLIHPIVVTRKKMLAAGQCRLEAYKLLDIAKIPAQFTDEVNEAELTAIELEENMKRQDLSWKDECAAYLKYHEYRAASDPEWGVKETADSIGYKKTNISIRLTVARALAEGNEQIQAADSVAAAYNVIRRKQNREIDAELEEVSTTVSSLDIEKGSAFIETASDEPITTKPKGPRKADKDLHVVNFDKAAPKFAAKKFNFLHCDFPYGINHDKSPMGGAATWGGYPDTPQTYWKLVEALIKHHDKFLTKSAHIMFWFSMVYYEETVAKFAAVPGFSVNPFPLVWHKSDNKGILPDPERGPRRTYETALMISRGDRKVVSPIANSYSAPTSKAEAIHISQKPEPVLRHFFRMFVDETTEMLDPTCGSSTALMAAEDCHAKRVQGWDMDKKYIEHARVALNQHRLLRSL